MDMNKGSIGFISAGLKGLAIEQKAILHNIANLDTPGYKAKKVSFENVLKDEGGKYDLKAEIESDKTASIRADGNNVNIDTESLKLYDNYIRQLYLFQKISGRMSSIRYILNQSAK